MAQAGVDESDVAERLGRPSGATLDIDDSH
jgi:hypothetical protein